MSENGRKFAWGRLRHDMRCLDADAKAEGEPGVTIHFGDGVTVLAAGTQQEGVDEDGEERPEKKRKKDKRPAWNNDFNDLGNEDED